MKWKIGDRVCREIYMDDGTWMQRGDNCLKHSPLKFGMVIELIKKPTWWGPEDMVLVQWDDGKEIKYYPHGLRSADLIEQKERKNARS